MIVAKACEIRSDKDRDDIFSDPKKIVTQFWQQWLEHRDALYRCCLKLMNSNPTDAEDALSGAMLKAWEKVQQLSRPVTNFKAWLMRLTSNFCFDIIRKRSREASGKISLEEMGDREVIDRWMPVETPAMALEREERYKLIAKAIASLPSGLRSTYILHYYEEQTHREIASIQGISYDNVCKRLERARKILKEELKGYFLGELGSASASESASTKGPTPPTQGTLHYRLEADDRKTRAPQTGKSADECVQVVAQVGEKQGLVWRKEQRSDRISTQGNEPDGEQQESPQPVGGLAGTARGSQATPPTQRNLHYRLEADDQKAQEILTGTEADESLQQVARVGEKLVVDAISPIDKEKISQLASDSGSQPQDDRKSENIEQCYGEQYVPKMAKQQEVCEPASGSDETEPEKSVRPTFALVEPVGSTVTLSIVMSEEESVVESSPPEVTLCLENVSSTATPTLIWSQQTYASNPHDCVIEIPNSDFSGTVLRTPNSELTLGGFNSIKNKLIAEYPTLRDFSLRTTYIQNLRSVGSHASQTGPPKQGWPEVDNIGCQISHPSHKSRRERSGLISSIGLKCIALRGREGIPRSPPATEKRRSQNL